MSIEEAKIFYKNHQTILRKLHALYNVGLGYIKLGQQATTLSGGESQRVKLSKELSDAQADLEKKQRKANLTQLEFQKLAEKQRQIRPQTNQ